MKQDFVASVNLMREHLGLSMLPGGSTPVPKENWPLWAKALGQVSNSNDKGIGDVVARVIGEPASDAFKTWHKATFGRDCNCVARQAKWNRMYSLK